MLHSLLKFCIKVFLFTTIYLWSFGFFIHFYPYVLTVLTQYLGGVSSRSIPIPTGVPTYTQHDEGPKEFHYKFEREDL